MTSLWRVLGAVLAGGCIWLVLRELQRSESQEIIASDVRRARQVAGRTWWGLAKRFQDAMRTKWWKVSRWSVGQRTKRKGMTKGQVEYKALVKIFNGERK